MTIKGRSPTMRHVSRTHRVAPDWLFDRINLDRKIKITFVNTRDQLADILTNGSFTRDEWNHFLRLINIINISTASSGHFRPMDYPQTMSKRLTREENPGEDERVVTKSKPARNPVSKTLNRFPTVLSSSTSQTPGNITAKSSICDSVGMEKPVARDSNQNSASSSQLRQPDVNPSSSTGILVTETTKNPVGSRLSHHNMTISSNNVGHLEKVYSNVQRKLGRPQNDEVEQININAMVWG